MSEKDKKSTMTQHWCPNLSAGVIILGDGENKKCLSSHLCGGDGSRCGKNTVTADIQGKQPQA